MKSSLINNIDKLGIGGTFLVAVFLPCRYPLFAFGASTLGFGRFELFEGWTMWLFLTPDGFRGWYFK